MDAKINTAAVLKTIRTLAEQRYTILKNVDPIIDLEYESESLGLYRRIDTQAPEALRAMARVEKKAANFPDLARAAARLKVSIGDVLDIEKKYQAVLKEVGAVITEFTKKVEARANTIDKEIEKEREKLYKERTKYEEIARKAGVSDERIERAIRGKHRDGGKMKGARKGRARARR